MNNYIVWMIIASTSAGLVTWGIMRVKLREMTAKADFYEGLSNLWEVISRDGGSYGSPCVDKGIAYINSVPSKGRRGHVREEVYRLLDRSYHDYLYRLHRKVNWYLARNDMIDDSDKSLHILFVQNGNWLAYDEDVCDWYDAATFEPSETGKSPNRMRKTLLEQRDACEKRLADRKAAVEERFRKDAEERLRMIETEQKCFGIHWSQSVFGT